MAPLFKTENRNTTFQTSHFRLQTYMGRAGQEVHGDHTDLKSRLVSEICSISTSYVSCVHNRHITSSHGLQLVHDEPRFIDWYRVLCVGEDAGMEVVRKQYHKLALLLHPDKNKHPKSETAFKLISEAYTCLSDRAKRRSFNSERWKKFCIECNKIPYSTNCKSPPIHAHSSKNKAWKPANWSRSCKFLRGIKERFREEARVIENCWSSTRASSSYSSPPVNPSENPFRSNSTLDSRIRRESPIFDPSDYIFQGYPHLRHRIYEKPYQNGWYLNRSGMSDSPIFENRSETRVFKAKSSTCVRS